MLLPLRLPPTMPLQPPAAVACSLVSPGLYSAYLFGVVTFGRFVSPLNRSGLNHGSGVRFRHRFCSRQRGCWLHFRWIVFCFRARGGCPSFARGGAPCEHGSFGPLRAGLEGTAVLPTAEPQQRFYMRSLLQRPAGLPISHLRREPEIVHSVCRGALGSGLCDWLTSSLLHEDGYG
jgi:hypothetical protein